MVELFDEKLCCEKVTLYYDDQWPAVYPQPGKTCQEKLDVTSQGKFQILPLDAPGPCELINNGETISCQGDRFFEAIMPRWWYLTVSNCESTQGVNLKYRMIMTNGDSFWTKHFSADENNILQTDIFFLICFGVLLLISLYAAYLLVNRQLLHTTYKLFLWTLTFELFSIVFNIGYYADYGTTGKPKPVLKNFGRACHCVYDTVFVVLLILLGKGWTVTRGAISISGQIKLTFFCTIYTIAYIALFIYETKAFDPAEVLYIYESPAGLGICVLRVLAWAWFCYGIFFTLKNYAEKRFFYYRFWAFYTLWFLSGPVIVLIATYLMESYVRAQIVNGVERGVALVSSLFFLILTRPSAANKNFPYHVRTTQIGIIEQSDADQNFAQRAYIPDTEEVRTRRHIAAMFSTQSYPHASSFGGLDSPDSEQGLKSAEFNNINGAQNAPTYANGHTKPYPQQQQPAAVIYRTEESLTSMFRAASAQGRTPTPSSSQTTSDQMEMHSPGSKNETVLVNHNAAHELSNGAEHFKNNMQTNETYFINGNVSGSIANQRDDDRIKDDDGLVTFSNNNNNLETRNSNPQASQSGDVKTPKNELPLRSKRGSTKLPPLKNKSKLPPITNKCNESVI